MEWIIMLICVITYENDMSNATCFAAYTKFSTSGIRLNDGWIILGINTTVSMPLNAFTMLS